MKQLGIMVHRLFGVKQHKAYQIAATDAGFDGIIVFTPALVRLRDRIVQGYVLQNGRQKKVAISFPYMIHDIGYYSSPSTVQKVKTIKYESGIPFVGYALGSKWTIQRHLDKISSVKDHLLPTRLYLSANQAIQSADEFGTIMIKPINGMKGRGIIRIRSGTNNYFVRQADGHRLEKSYARHELTAYLNKHLSKGKAIIQKWIDIRGKDGQVFDIRALVQKNDRGEWNLAAMGVRKGARERITSNLASGGSAYEVMPFLLQQYDRETAKRIHLELHRIADTLPAELEKSYEQRFVEFGIDMAVERTGAVWLLEVNIKPGRKIVAALKGKKAYDISFRSPIKYAAFLLRTGAPLPRRHAGP